MSRSFYRRRRSNDSPSGVLLLLGIIVLVTFYNQLSVKQIEMVVFVSLGVAVFITGILLFIQYKMRQHRLKKLRALTFVDTEMMDGLVFEKYVAELLKNQGYRKVTLTERYDFGVDIIAVKGGVRWGVQVKRYSNMVKAEAVRQVVTALNTYECQRSMVVTNSVFSRPAKILAESNGCVLIDRDVLAEWIMSFQEAKSHKDA